MDLPTKKMLTLDSARTAMAACEAAAQKGGWKVVVAIVDDGGHAVLVQRLDGAQWSSIETALGKARAAVAWKRPTRLLEESVNNRADCRSFPCPGRSLSCRAACRSRWTGPSSAPSASRA